MLTKVFILLILHSFIYLWLGLVARKECIQRRLWIEENEQTNPFRFFFREILISPIFSVLGILFFIGMTIIFTSIWVVYSVPFFILLSIFYVAYFS